MIENPNPAAPMTALTLRLQDEMFAIAAGGVREILDLVPITDVPNAPPFAAGLINVRGSVVPLTDPRVMFGMDPAAPRRRHPHRRHGSRDLGRADHCRHSRRQGPRRHRDRGRRHPGSSPTWPPYSPPRAPEPRHSLQKKGQHCETSLAVTVAAVFSAADPPTPPNHNI